MPTSTTQPPSVCELLTAAYLNFPPAAASLVPALQAAGCQIPPTTSSSTLPL